jgi:ketosteroid isomerase-like protein
MKAILYLIGTLLLCLPGAQAQKNLKGMIEAERNFAASAAINSVKQAFLLYMDKEAIEFEQGQVVKSHALWTSRTEDKVVLKWQPQFAEVSASGDFGYTTGPWTFQASKQDTITGRGQSTTIWHYVDGQWKFLLDIGNDYRKVNHTRDVEEIKFKKKKKGSDQAALLAVEKEFAAACTRDIKAAHNQYLSENSIINRNGHLPAFSDQDRQLVVSTLPAGIQFNVSDSHIAPSGDLGYVYGTTNLNGRRDVFLHIWRYEKDGWKLALEVLHH